MVEPDCVSNLDDCGWERLGQTNYRGSMNVTTDGTPCERWDADWVKEALQYDYPETWKEIIDGFDLEGNYCRNFDPEYSDRAHCYKAGGTFDNHGSDWEYCDVPNCRLEHIPKCHSPTPSWCKKPDNETCGCGDLKQSDYRGKISVTQNGDRCGYWSDWYDEYFQDYPMSGIGEEDSSGVIVPNNFCRNPHVSLGDLYSDRAWCLTGDWWVPDPKQGWEVCDVPMCDPRTCGMPSCGNPNLSNSSCLSFLQAEECCQDNDSSCKCALLKDACRISLENNSEDFCDDAILACYGDIYEQNHICNMYEQICTEHPGQLTCDAAARKCCNHSYFTAREQEQCKCDFYTYTSKNMEIRTNLMEENCNAATVASSTPVKVSLTPIKDQLKYFYNHTGGDNWSNNSGWMNDTLHYCKWYGLACNDNRDITGINLRNNSLAGHFNFIDLDFPWLTTLDLAENKLSGIVSIGFAMFLRRLEYIDISENGLSGCADLTFSSSMLHANFSNNNFTCASFKRYNPAYKTLRVLDLSHNSIKQDASHIFRNAPLNLEELILSHNNIRGGLPEPFPILENIRRLDVSFNTVSGPLPDFTRSTPRIREIDLSHQTKTKIGGLTGTISPDFSRLQDLLVLNLAFNKLTSFPSDIGALQKLKLLDLSSNSLSQTIPSELGKLNALEILNLSNNALTQLIPESFDNFVEEDYTSIFLGGNLKLLDPAPLVLCFLSDFDFAQDNKKCPPERSALKDFYESAKGQEWTIDTLWLDSYASHCFWHGVDCSSSNETVRLNLKNNGLSGTLSTTIGDLPMLQELDLSDNDIKGFVPLEIGQLSRLVSLRLSYNELTGTMPNDFFSNLTKLKLIQLHSNRIRGTITNLEWTEEKWEEKDHLLILTSYDSSFITDCGNPSDFEKSLKCENCTMCCNAQGNCYPNKDTDIQKTRIKNYTNFSLVYFASFVGVTLIVVLVLSAFNRHKDRHLPGTSIRQLSVKDQKYALGALGADSVYQFFMGKSCCGWSIAIATVAFQLGMLFIFVEAAEIDLSSDNVDLTYTWRCPRDQIDCENKADLNWQGWTVFAILMGTHLLKDIINGSKMIILSSRQRHPPRDRLRFFCGGFLLSSVALFTMYVSTIYNMAIATSNTELIMNSVIILFITDTDEQVFDVLMVLNSRWVTAMSRKKNDDKRDDEMGNGGSLQELRDQNFQLLDEVRELRNENAKLKGEMSELKNVITSVRQEMTQINKRVGQEDTSKWESDENEEKIPY